MTVLASRLWLDVICRPGLRAAARCAGIAPLVIALASPAPPAESSRGSWPQFRGPNASGIAAGVEALPDEIGPDRSVVWKTAVPFGHSSPVILGGLVFITGVREATGRADGDRARSPDAADGPGPGDAAPSLRRRLVTIALDAGTGRILWERDAAHEDLEAVHPIGSLAQPTPAAAEEGVYSFFGSCGLLAYTREGDLRWRVPMGPFNDDYGASSSPVIAGSFVIVNQDHDSDSFLAAIDRRTGRAAWKADRSEFLRSYATPVLWDSAGERQIVVCGMLRMVGYSLETGEEAWTVRGLSRLANMTPVVGDDGNLYAALWAPGGDASDRIRPPPFDEYAAEHDENRSETLEVGEMPPSDPMRGRFRQIDIDKDGRITRREYESMRAVFERSSNKLVAVRPGGKGDITGTHVLWTYDRLLPYIPSPLYYRGHIYLVKNAGIVSCLDASTGEAQKQSRVSGRGNYYSSPVAGDGKIYLLSERGELSIITAEPQWKEVSTSEFRERAYATPAIALGRIYVRTAGHLWCFERPDGKKDEGRSSDD